MSKTRSRSLLILAAATALVALPSCQNKAETERQGAPASTAPGKSQYFPLQSYRVGPYAAGGSGFFGGAETAKSYDEVASTANLEELGTTRQFWGAYVGFDRRVRAGPNDFTMHPTPEHLRRSLRDCFGNMSRFQRPSPNLLFVTAWNEWNEQAVLEPDTVHRDAMLRVLRSALREVPVRFVVEGNRSSLG